MILVPLPRRTQKNKNIENQTPEKVHPGTLSILILSLRRPKSRILGILTQNPLVSKTVQPNPYPLGPFYFRSFSSVLRTLIWDGFRDCLGTWYVRISFQVPIVDFDFIHLSLTRLSLCFYNIKIKQFKDDLLVVFVVFRREEFSLLFWLSEILYSECYKFCGTF